MKTDRYSLKVISLKVAAPQPNGSVVSSPEDVKAIVRTYFESVRDDRERFVALMLTSKHTLLGITEVSTGGSTLTIVDPKVLFRTLLVMGATSFILAHNHPSGDTSPSSEDRALTKRLIAGGELLGLQCLDHFIVGDGTDRILSMLEMGQFGLHMSAK